MFDQFVELSNRGHTDEFPPFFPFAEYGKKMGIIFEFAEKVRMRRRREAQQEAFAERLEFKYCKNSGTRQKRLEVEI